MSIDFQPRAFIFTFQAESCREPQIITFILIYLCSVLYSRFLYIIP